MARLDPAVLDHLEWIGFVQPTGLVVSAPALVRAGAILDRGDIEGQRLLETCVAEAGTADPEPYLPAFTDFAYTVLGWSFSPKGYAGMEVAPIPNELEVPLPDYGETLRPDFAVREPDPAEGGSGWQLLVKVVEAGVSLDAVVDSDGRLEASPHGRLERLLRETGVSAGLIFNGHVVRLISAPRGESSGWVDFKVAEMLQTAGRPISAAMRLLLREQRLLALPRGQRLGALLADSRKFQNEVSERLSEQVLHALYELLRGFQAAHDLSGGDLLKKPLDEDPDEVYRAMLTVILRLVFLLYAEERDMFPQDDDTFLQSYSVASLYERLREDASLYPDTMAQRYGAWAQLLTLFRLVHDGANLGAIQIPPRHGALFDPDRYSFLEGRAEGGARQIHERIDPPLVSDATVWSVLEDLLILDGERISYRALDVEQIGSVYETMMGFRLETASGRSVAIKPQKRHGAPATVDLEEALAQPASKRGKWMADHSFRKLTSNVTQAVAAAHSPEDLHAALQPVVDRAATPDLVPKGAMVLQPSEERRRSGSHYTPRTLTEPIVRTTLEPVVARLAEDGPIPTPDQILDLKVCDPAMGSGAFLVETCRQLSDALVESWRFHDRVPEIPSDEDELTFARRLVAQQCLYGVDRNPVAVDLAKMSLWLITLAREHSFTFLDHALRHGDSLVGLPNKQIENFHWDVSKTWDSPFRKRLREHTAKVADLRLKIRQADEDVTDWELRDLWDEAEAELDKARLYGDLVVAAFFEGKTPKTRQSRRDAYVHAVTAAEEESYRGMLEGWRQAEPPLAPFHWELELPEVFDRSNPGFDAIVGNPPFQGGRRISTVQGDAYSSWLLASNPDSRGSADLAAHFFRRSFALVRSDGTFGLLATKTIAQGDTRVSGLAWICHNGGEIYAATKRYRWPGAAAVVVSIVHVIKGNVHSTRVLDGRLVGTITAFLFHAGGHDDPVRLAVNQGRSFVGTLILGMGFTFDDTDKKAVASPLAEMRRLIKKDSTNADVIVPYLGGEEVNTNPTHTPHRYVINFGERTEEECRRQWPDLMELVEQRVKPERITKNASKYPRMVNEWWKFWNPRFEMYSEMANLERVLVTARVAMVYAPTFVPTNQILSEQLIVFADPRDSFFSVMASRVHEVFWVFQASTFGSSDAPRYTPRKCFETFPFPERWDTQSDLETVGREYYEFRANLMVVEDEGLTKTYNRFHSPEEQRPEIVELRALHAAIDRAVLDSYGWSDIPSDCEFLLEHEIDEEEWGSKKKPWRYRWPDEVRDEVLARLLELNATRAAAEARVGATGGMLFE
jgi:hypothetical protein